MKLVSAGSAFRNHVGDTIRGARGRLGGEIPSDTSSYGHAVALTKFAGLIESLAERLWKSLGWKRSRNSMIRAAREVHQVVDPLIARDMRKSACRNGCFFCCFQPVEANIPEILLIADHLRQNLSPEQMSALRERIDDHQQKVKANPDGNALCPLNVEGSCTVYEARPLLCRGFNSLDAKECEAVFHEGRDRPIHYAGDPVAVTRAADLAFQVATRFHFPDERVSGFSLVPSLKYALDHPAETAEKAFLEGCP
jgi:Fe-S-cluster containining protein